MTSTDADILDGLQCSDQGMKAGGLLPFPTRRGPLVSHGVTLPDVFTVVSRFRAQDTTFSRRDGSCMPEMAKRARAFSNCR